MKSSRTRRIVGLIVAVLLLSGILSACKQSQGPDATGPSAKTQSPTDAPTADPGSKEEPLVIKILSPGGATLASDEPTRIEQAIMERTNTRLIFDGAPWAEYFESINLSMVSGELPDLMFAFPGANTLQWYLDGFLSPINDYLDEAPNLQKLFSLENYKYTTYNGDYTFVPYVSESCNMGWIYRADWADNLGIGQPEDIDDFYEMLRAFTQDDPDGNGEDDTIGLGGDVEVVISFWGVYTWAGLTTDANGDVVYGHTTEDFKNGMRFARRIYADGFANSEYFAEDSDTRNEKIINGVYGVSFQNTGMHMINRYQVPGSQANEEYRLGYFNPYPKVEGTVHTAGMPGLPGYFGGTFITTATQDLGRLVQFLDQLYSEEIMKLMHWGIEGVSYTGDLDGDFRLNLEERVADEFFGEDGLQYSQWALNMVATALPIFLNMDPPLVTKKHQYNFPVPEYNVIAEESDLYAERTPIMSLDDGVFLDVPTEINDMRGRVHDIDYTWMVYFVTGEKDIDDDWDEYMALLEEAGLSQYVDAYAQALREVGKVG